MTMTIDCGRWQVLASGVGIDPEDADAATYDEILCVYDVLADTAVTGELAMRTRWHVIPGLVFAGALRRAAGLEPRGDFYERYLQKYRD